MGVHYSKGMAESRPGTETNEKQNANRSFSHRHSDNVMPMKRLHGGYGAHHHSHHSAVHIYSSARDEAEEEKVSETVSESDFKQNLATLFSSMVNMEDQAGARRHSSRSAVYPITDEQEHQRTTTPPLHTKPMESLPPPVHELSRRRADTTSSSASLPVRVQTRTTRTGGMSCITEDDYDSEYLNKVYDLRTWSMYKLITESRRKRSIQYQPSIVEETKSTDQDEDESLHLQESLDEGSSFTTNMIFAFDFE